MTIYNEFGERLNVCEVCNCMLPTGDICPQCEREQQANNLPEFQGEQPIAPNQAGYYVSETFNQDGPK